MTARPSPATLREVSQAIKRVMDSMEKATVPAEIMSAMMETEPMNGTLTTNFDRMREAEAYLRRLLEYHGLSASNLIDSDTPAIDSLLALARRAIEALGVRGALAYGTERLESALGILGEAHVSDLRPQVTAEVGLLEYVAQRRETTTQKGLAEEVKPASAAQADKPDAESMALGILAKEPGISMTELAKRVGVERQTLYDWAKLRQAIKVVEAAGKRKARARYGRAADRDDLS